MAEVIALHDRLESRVTSCYTCPFSTPSTVQLATLVSGDCEWACKATKRTLGHGQNAPDTPPPEWCPLRHHKEVRVYLVKEGGGSA